MDVMVPQSDQRNTASVPNHGHILTRQTLFDSTNEGTKREIAERFFGAIADNGDVHALKQYFDFYNKELRRLRVGITPLVSGLDTKTHKDLFYIRDIIFDSRAESREAVRARILPKIPTEDELSLDRMVDLTIRLWLMINIRDDALSLSSWRPQESSARWDEPDSLVKFVALQFPTSTTELEIKRSRLKTNFTVAYMVRTCRLQVKWTDDLVNHLRLDRGPNAKMLSVFPHKAFLIAHLRNW